jgi:U5 small nuclear ribonucleoprotein component
VSLSGWDEGFTLTALRFFPSSINPDESLRMSPERGNVAFASAQMGWVFTLRSFAQMYSDTYGESCEAVQHGQR